MEGFARLDFGDEDVDNFVTVSLPKHGGCRIILL